MIFKLKMFKMKITLSEIVEGKTLEIADGVNVGMQPARHKSGAGCIVRKNMH